MPFRDDGSLCLRGAETTAETASGAKNDNDSLPRRSWLIRPCDPLMLLLLLRGCEISIETGTRVAVAESRLRVGWGCNETLAHDAHALALKREQAPALALLPRVACLLAARLAPRPLAPRERRPNRVAQSSSFVSLSSISHRLSPSHIRWTPLIVSTGSTTQRTARERPLVSPLQPLVLVTTT